VGIWKFALVRVRSGIDSQSEYRRRLEVLESGVAKVNTARGKAISSSHGGFFITDICLLSNPLGER
jgi:hypothetical protein